MAINISIYSNGNSSSRTVAVDFLTEVLSSSNANSFSSTQQHFFKFSSTARDEDGDIFHVRLVENEDQLALNDQTWASANAASDAGVAVTDPYPSIKTMIYDYVYDWVNGRDSNQNGSGVTARAKMDFS